jgi:hypothetical protein
VDFSVYHHILTSSSVHPAASGNDARSPVRLKCVTDRCLVPRGLCPLIYTCCGAGACLLCCSSLLAVGWWNHHQVTMVVMYLQYLLYWYRLSMYVIESLTVGISRQNRVITKHFAVMYMINHYSLYSVAVRATVRCSEVFCWSDVFSVLLNISKWKVLQSLGI